MIINFYLLIIFAAIIGLIIGSFLNVIIVRFPIMLETRWRQECQAFLQQPVESIAQPLNLLLPRSHCPHCRTTIKIRHNIPILSYLLLRGRCAACKQRIAIQYPLVELLTAITTVFIVYHFNLTWQALALSILTWVLIVLFFIDLKKQILPDIITLTTLWLGLLISLFYLFVTPYQAILGAIIGYSLLWITGTVYKLIRKKDGMGHGDYKMLAMLGAWLGVEMVLNILLLAIGLGLIISIFLLIIKKISAKNPIPFGPFIAVAAWISLFTGPVIIHLIVPTMT
jgi:leader peptidase (prepilin peptidase)/N-methyltransferase